MIWTFRRFALLPSIATCLALGQPQSDSPARDDRFAGVSFEAIPFFSADTSESPVNVHYRIPEQFFVIQRDPNASGSVQYVAKGEFLAELLDERGNSAGREFRSITILRDAPRDDQVKLPDLQGAFTLNVPPGKYSILVTVDDLQSERSFLSKDQLVVTRKPSTKGMDLSAPVFCQASSESSGEPFYQALNHGTDVFFGERGGLLFNVYAAAPLATVSVRYEIKHRPGQAQLEIQEFSGGSLVLHPGIAALAPSKNDPSFSSAEPIRYGIRPAGSPWYALFIPLPLEKLHPGRGDVKIEIQSGNLAAKFERTFRVIWPDQPRSLSDFDLAVDALQHIASEEELESLRSFSDTRAVRAFFDFWRAKDPDTSTAYNPMMHEYYRRVDIANLSYSGPREIDGYKTDRGRIYALYGSPAKTERLFSPGHPPREIWTYPTAGRRFVFEDQTRTGIYVLVAVEEL